MNYQDRLTTMLKACLSAFNELPRRTIKNNTYPDTYSLASAIDKLLAEDPIPTWKEVGEADEEGDDSLDSQDLVVKYMKLP